MEKSKKLPTIDDTSLLDESISEPISIMDVSTDEIVYLNKAGKQIFKLTSKSIGEKCYKAFAGKTERCQDCLAYKMKVVGPEIYQKIKGNDVLGITYVLKSCYVMYKGKLCRMETMAHLPNNINEISAFSESLKFQKVLMKVSNVSLAGRDFHAVLLEGLAELGNFFGAERGFVFELKDGYFSNTVEWCKKGINSKKALFEKVPESLLRAHFGKEFDKKEAVHLPLAYPFDPKEEDWGQKCRQNGVDSFLFQPIHQDGQLIGFFGFDNPKHRDIEDYALNSLALNLEALFSKYRTINEISTDKETGLMTDELFWLEVKEMAKTVKGRLVLGRFDIAHYGIMSGFYGPKFINELLSKTGSMLSHSFSNVLAATHIRGSDQFIVLFKGLVRDANETLSILAKGLSSLRNELLVVFHNGFYILNDPNEDPSSMNSKLFLAHHEARSFPDLPYIVYNENIKKRNDKEGQIVADFQSAIDNEEFKLYVQPKYDMATQSFFGAEALSRWVKDGKMIMPVDFIPVLEKYGLITALDRYVLIHVLSYLKGELDAGRDPAPIAINLSRFDFGETGLFQRLINVVDSYMVPHGLIELEITESAFIKNEKLIIEFINKCHENGFVVVMDDFGSGYSSLNSLKDLDIDGLKMDYKFFATSSSPTKRNAVIRSVISMAKELRIQFTVEGISEKEDALYLMNLGATKIQGFYFAKPMPIEDYKNLPTKKEFDISTSIDSSVYDDLMDPKSTIHQLFNNSLIYMGVYRYYDKCLYQIMDNTVLGKTRPLVELEPGNSVIEDIVSEDRPGFLAYLDSVVAGAPNAEFHEFTRAFQDKFIRLRLKASLLRRGDKGSAVFIETMAISNPTALKKGSFSFSNEQISWLMEKGNEPIAFVSSKNDITYYNAAFSKLFPSVRIGSVLPKLLLNAVASLKNFTDFDTHDLDFVTVASSEFAISFRNLIVEGEPVTLLRLRPLGERQNALYGNQATRIGHALLSLVEGYLDVDLSSGYFRYTEKPTSTSPIGVKRGDKEDLKLLVNGISSKLVEDPKAYLAFVNLEALRAASKNGKDISLGIKVKDKEIYKILLATFSKDENGAPHAMVFRIDDTSEHLKDFDSLTGLLNRSEGKRRVNDFIAQHPGARCYLSIIDLDRFKEYNDKYGHPFGDKVLTKVSEIFQNLGPGWMFPCRLGGDEFSVFYFDEGNKLDENAFRESLSKRFAEVSKSMGIEEKLNGQAGVSCYPQDGLDFDDLYHKADESLYLTKQLKRILR